MTDYDPEFLNKCRDQIDKFEAQIKALREIGWAQEMANGKLLLMETNALREDIHDNGRPMYRLLIRTAAAQSHESPQTDRNAVSHESASAAATPRTESLREKHTAERIAFVGGMALDRDMRSNHNMEWEQLAIDLEAQIEELRAAMEPLIETAEERYQYASVLSAYDPLFRMKAKERREEIDAAKAAMKEGK